MRSYYHRGEIGDILYAMMMIKAAGGGNLFVRRESVHEHLNWHLLHRLVALQPYIHRFEEVTGPPQVDINAGEVQDMRVCIDMGGHCAPPNIIKPYFQHNHITFGYAPWLEGVKSAKYPDDEPYTVINVTHRYRDGHHRWGEYLPAGQMRFIGLHDEFTAFTRHLRDTGYERVLGRIRWIHTPDMLAAAEQIAGARAFYGNCSSCLALAQGIGVQDIFVEVAQNTQNTCLFGFEKVLNGQKV